MVNCPRWYNTHRFTNTWLQPTRKPCTRQFWFSSVQRTVFFDRNKTCFVYQLPTQSDSRTLLTRLPHNCHTTMIMQSKLPYAPCAKSCPDNGTAQRTAPTTCKWNKTNWISWTQTIKSSLQRFTSWAAAVQHLDFQGARVQGAGSQSGTSTSQRGRVEGARSQSGTSTRGRISKGQDLKGARVQGGRISKGHQYDLKGARDYNWPTRSPCTPVPEGLKEILISHEN
jgi:hypothetical protein